MALGGVSEEDEWWVALSEMGSEGISEETTTTGGAGDVLSASV